MLVHTITTRRYTMFKHLPKYGVLKNSTEYDQHTTAVFVAIMLRDMDYREVETSLT